MLLTSVVLHGAAVLLVNGASSSSSGPPIDGLRLPLMAVALVVHPPEQRASRQTDAAVAPVAPDLPDLSIAQAPPPDAPRLLTPVPRPVENKGGDQPAAAVMGLMATHYFPTHALTTRPAPTTEPHMQLPDGWLEAFGQARLILFLSDAGNVDAITLTPLNLAPELHDAVRAAFQALHFSPGEIDGRPVASVMTIEVDVSLALGKNR